MDGQRRLGTETVHVVHFSGQRKSNLEIRKSMKRRKRLPEGEEERRYVEGKKRKGEKNTGGKGSWDKERDSYV